MAKTSRRVVVALTLSVGVGLLLWAPWTGSPSSLFLCAMALGLAGTTVFSLFEVWPRRLPRWSPEVPFTRYHLPR